MADSHGYTGGGPSMPRKSQPIDPMQAESLKAAMEQKRAALDATKVAYFNGTPFGEGVPDEETLTRTAQEFIFANYAYQKLLYGRVRVKLSAANLLR